MALYKGAVGSNKQARIGAIADGLVQFTDFYEFFDDELQVGNSGRWTLNNAGGGTVVRGARSKQLLKANGVLGDQGGMVFGVNSGGFPLMLPNGAGSKFFIEMRGRAVTAPDANTVMCVGDQIEYLIGVRGATSTTKFCARFSNGPTALTSVITIDTLFHIIRCWRDGTTTFLSVDGEAPVSSAAAFATNEERLHLACFENAAVAQTFEPDYLFVRAER